MKLRLSLLLLVALAAGCTTETSGSANPAPLGARTASPRTGAAPSTSRRSGKSAPQVSKPLNTASLTSDPCSALSAGQRSQLGLGDGTAKSSGCEWPYRDQSGNVDIALDANPDGLQGLYDQRSQFAYFEPTLVFGYPGVSAAEKDLRAQGECRLHVAVTDQRTATVTTQITSGPGATSPCSFALKAGVDMIETLKGS